MIKPITLRTLLGAGLLCAAGFTVRADDTVTFQVNMSRYTNSAGAQAATLVDVRGAFNGWSGGPGATLVNNGANVYTNTFTVAGTTGDKFQYKFTYSTCAGTTWEDNNPPPGAGQPADEGNNRVLQLIGGAQTLPVVSHYAPSVATPINLVGANITFRVDMTEQVQLGNFIPSSGIDTNTVTGAPAALTSFGIGVGLTNNPALAGNASNIYSAVINVCGTPGSTGIEFKFRLNNGWEDTSDNDNRKFNFTGADQVLPLYYYSDQPVGPLTNGNITFQVDMTPQVFTGGFTNGVSAVRVSGNINGWPGGATGGELLTNNPALSGNASNIYSGTIPLPANNTATVGNWSRYKFRADGGWEAAAIYGVGGNKDRRFFITGGDQVLPLVTYNDASLCDVLLQPTTTTFRLHLTNGTPDRNGVPFDKVNDKVYFNAEFLGWPTWNTASLLEMTNNPVGSDYYEQTYVLSGGTSRRLQFKFGLADPASPSGTHGFLDNETGFQQDHVKYVRTLGPITTITAEFGTNFLAILQEPQFGDLVAGPPAGGNVPITWLGLPCVTLQTKTTVGAGAWTDLPATDARSSTNWPNTGGTRFFRLQKRPLP